MPVDVFCYLCINNRKTIMTTDKRDSIIKKINALKEKTVANGCSESEAMSAANAISKLLQEYDLSMTDVEVKSQEFITDLIVINSKIKKPIHSIIFYISYLTDTEHFFSKKDGVFTYRFFGTKRDVDFAVYLFHLLSNSMDYEFSKFKKTEQYKLSHGKSSRSSFYSGMITRLGQRLRDMKDRIKNENKEHGLMLYDKMVITTEMFKKHNPNLKIHEEVTKLRVTSLGAFEQGKSAADRVNITTGLNGKSSNDLRLKS